MFGRPRGTLAIMSFAITIGAVVALLGSATPTIAAAPPDSAAPPPHGVIFVDDDAPPGGNGHNWRQAFRHLQDALAYAELPGNDVREIRVAQGTYKPDHGLWVEPLDQHATFFLIDGVALRGGYRGHYAPADAVAAGNPHERNIHLYRTVLDGDLLDDLFSYDDNSFHIVTAIHVGPRTELEGFEIREATDDPDALPPEPTSGALLVIGGAPLIQRCTFADNRGHNDSGSCVLNDTEAVIRKCRFLFNLSNGNAGGMSITFGHPKIEDCTFTNNVAFYEAGGALGGWATEAEIRRCTFIANSAGNQGGAVWIGASPLVIIEDCVYLGNGAGWEGGGHWGGGTLTRCVFIENSANTEGGGMRGSGTVIDSMFIGNESGFNGGSAIMGGGTRINCVFLGNRALSFSGGGAAWANFDATFVNCLFSGNESSGAAGALYVDPGRTVNAINCIFASNIGTGPQAQSIVGNAVLSNCIVWGNNGGSVDSLVHAQFSCIEGGLPGPGNISVNPRFVNPLGFDGVAGTRDDDLRLRHESRCIDRGANSLLPVDVFDLDNDGNAAEMLPIDLARQPRVLAVHRAPATVDMGAYEFVPSPSIISLHPADLMPWRPAHE